MLSVKKLKELLASMPDEARCYAYEGEIIGIVFRHEGKELGYVAADEDDEENTGQLERYGI